MITKRPPTPEELWGDIEIIGWMDNKSRNCWNLWLKATAALLLFADQIVIDRVNKVVVETIAKAKSGEILPEEALVRISPTNLISPEEWEVLNETVKEDGQMISTFFYGNTGEN